MWMGNNNKPWKGGKYGLRENHTIMYRRVTLLYFTYSYIYTVQKQNIIYDNVEIHIGPKNNNYNS